MGYRSELFIKVTANHREALDKMMSDNDLVDSFKFIHDDDYSYAYGGWLKFYTGYKDVDAVIAFIADDETDEEKAMVAIGEDNATDSWGACDALSLYAVSDIDSDYFPIGDIR